MQVDKFPRTSSRAARWWQQVRVARRTSVVGLFSAGVAVATHTVFPLIRWRNRRLIAKGQTVWLEDMPGPPQRQTFPDLDATPADLVPGTEKRRKARHMKVDYPAPVYPFAYRDPPVSGNTVNGRGEVAPRRASHVFFGDGYGRAWGRLDWYLQVMEPTNIHRTIVRMFWQDRKRVGMPAQERSAPVDPAAASALVVQLGIDAGATMVGITRLTDDMRFDDFDVPYTYAISVLVAMDREAMLHTPTNRSGLEIMRSYLDGNRVAIELPGFAHAAGLRVPAPTSHRTLTRCCTCAWPWRRGWVSSGSTGRSSPGTSDRMSGWRPS